MRGACESTRLARRCLKKENVQTMKQMQTRREFIGAGCAALAGAAATKSLAAVRPEPAFMWGVLLHFGVNIQCDLPVTQWGKYKGEDLKLMTAADHVRFDEGVFDRITDRMAAKGLNTVVMDLEEGRYPSSTSPRPTTSGSRSTTRWSRRRSTTASARMSSRT